MLERLDQIVVHLQQHVSNSSIGVDAVPKSCSDFHSLWRVMLKQTHHGGAFGKRALDGRCKEAIGAEAQNGAASP